jgi:uncharacterized protein
VKRVAAALLCATLFAPVGARAEEMRLQTPVGVYSPQVTSWRDLPFKTVIRQRHDFSCGSAALATLLTYHYDRPVDEATVFTAMFESGDQQRIRERGFSLLDMQTYLAERGLAADGYRLTLDRLAELETPAIVMIAPNGYRHFVVVKGVRGDQVLVGDPAAGLRIYTREEFEPIWSGVTFVIHGETVQGRFNRRDEWDTRGITSIADTMPRRPVEQLTRDLPPLYQITPVIDLDQ